MNDQTVVQPASPTEVPGIEIREFVIDADGNEIPVEQTKVK